MRRCSWLHKTARSGALALLVAVIVGGPINRASATQLEGGSYANETYGFSVEWDEAVWTMTPLDSPAGEGLSAATGKTWGMVYGIDVEKDSTDFFADMVGEFRDGETSDLAIAPKTLMRPVAPDGFEGELVIVEYGTGSDAVRLLGYLGCRPVNDGAAVLNIVLMSAESAYRQELDHWQSLLDGVKVLDKREKPAREIPSIGRVENIRVNERRAGLNGDTYGNPELGFDLSWDEAYWTASEINRASIQGVQLESDNSYALIGGFKARGTVEECVQGVIDGTTENTTFTDMRVASNRYERPALTNGGAGELYTLVESSTNASMAWYVECRSIPETGSFVILEFFAPLPVYQQELPAWQEVLDQVETVGQDTPGAVGADAALS